MHMLHGQSKNTTGMSHSDRCRARIRKNIQEDDDVQDRIAKADTRQKRDKIQSYIGRAQAVRTTSEKHIGKLEKDIRHQMMKLMAEDMDVAEIYSPPRIAVKAKEMGLRAGWSLDLANRDVDGKR